MSVKQQRKPNRMKNYDYSQNGGYFITVCTKNRAEIFGRIISNNENNNNKTTVGEASCRPFSCRPYPKNNFIENNNIVNLTEIGKIVENEISLLSSIYPSVTVDKYIIMPNHIHIIIIISNNGRQDAAPTVSRIMNQFKRAISIKIGFSPWQKSFHDHIIRDKNEYERIRKYIDNNPKTHSQTV